MARMRRAVLAGLLGLLAVPAPARAAAPPALGAWRLTFTPETVRAVGQKIPRGQTMCEGPCAASYQFTEPGAGDGRTTLLFFKIEGDCPGAPCDLRSGPAFGDKGFTAPIHWDGTTYTGMGKGFFRTGECHDLPEGIDTVRFTVEGEGRDRRLTGTMSAVLSVVGPTRGNNGECITTTGYEVYTGSFVGVPFGAGAGSAVPSAAPGAGAGEPVNGGVPVSAAAARALRADAFAAASHDRPVLSTHVATARTLPWRPSRVAVSALLALLLVVLMPFPAALFNNTLEQNYAEVSGWFAFLHRRPREERVPRPWRDFALLVGAVAVLDAFLDPGLGFDTASVVLVAGLALSVAAVSLLSSVPARLHARRHGEVVQVTLYPIGLGVAAFCVLVSRVTSFEPGYLYGVVAGFAFARELERAEKGLVTVLTSALLLAAAVAAFLLRVPVHDAVARDGGVALALLDTVLAAVFAAGIEANVIGLLPVSFMPGDAVMTWSRPAWAAAFGISVFAFLHALSAAAGGATTGASVRTAAALFGVFGAVSVAFWAYFRRRRRDPTPVSV
jgi:hypothetical protein